MDLQSYMTILSNSIIKQKQVLTVIGKQILTLPEHQLLYENLKRKYPERNLDSSYASNDVDTVTMANNQPLRNETTSNQSTNIQSTTNQDTVTIVSDEILPHHNDEQTYNPLNQLLEQLHANSSVEQSNNMSSSNNIIHTSPIHIVPDNSTNHQVSNIYDAINIRNHEQSLSIRENTVSALNLEKSSDINDYPLNLTQTNFTEQISAFIISDHQEQVALNIHDEHNNTPFIEIENNEITTSYMNNSEPTSSNIKHHINTHSRHIQRNKRNTCDKESVKHKKTYKKTK
ncbi:unnamed protein product [Rotaria sordida]|uniref:Uncharacterized protein n=2 Tax=Rotaria sordida TaxID=392033 RepID=A0A819UQV8_9BILA|nr:unnamed protein product [Rotaria sordida]